MDQILRCYWPPEQARWRYLARSGVPAVPQEKFLGKPYSEYFIDQACAIKTGLVYCLDFMDFRLRLVPLTRKLKKKTWPKSSNLGLALGQ